MVPDTLKLKLLHDQKRVMGTEESRPEFLIRKKLTQKHTETHPFTPTPTHIHTTTHSHHLKTHTHT